MKRGKKLLILLVCMVVIALAAWGATKLFAPEENITPMDGGDTIFALGDTKLLSWRYEDMQITFDISADTWVCSEDETYTISKLYQSDILNQLTDLKSQKVITDPGDLADYGLTEPTCVITADNKQILIGDSTGVGNHVYVSIGDGKVYLVSETLLYPFRHSLAKMIQIPSLPDLSLVTAVTVTSPEDTLALICDENRNWFLKNEEAQHSINEQIGATLSDYLTKLRFTACADIDLQAPEVYGLDTPSATYQIHYITQEGEAELTLILGDACSDGVYVMMGSSNRVYLINEVSGSFLTQLSKETLISEEAPEEE